MALTAVNFVTKGPVLHNDLLQFYNLFTGVMTDQPITFQNTLSVGGSQGTSTVPLKVYGAVGQTTHLLDLYGDHTQSQPGWGMASLGQMGWGPGGSGAQDTFLSRVATQNGHSSDTAGLLISPYLEVAGGIAFNGALGFLTSGASISQGGAGSLRLILNQDLTVNRDVSVGRNVVFSQSGASISQGGAGTLLAVVNQNLEVAGGTAAIGAAPSNQVGLAVYVNYLAQNAQMAIDISLTASSAGTAWVVGERIQVNTPASLATGALYAITIGTPVLGAGSTSGNNYGMFVSNMGGTGVTNAYGIWIQAQSGASGQNYGLHSEASVDVNNLIRATNIGSYPVGAGMEVGYQPSGPYGFVQAFDRGAGAYRDVWISGANIRLMPNAPGLVIANLPFYYNSGPLVTIPAGNTWFLYFKLGSSVPTGTYIGFVLCTFAPTGGGNSTCYAGLGTPSAGTLLGYTYNTLAADGASRIVVWSGQVSNNAVQDIWCQCYSNLGGQVATGLAWLIRIA